MSSTDLAAIFRRLIAATGPISLAQFMGEANAHYYGERTPFGSRGDFITAPDISQVFGEMCGLWLADLWHRAGGRGGKGGKGGRGGAQPVHYVELGPGRGTLARDALRAMTAAGLAAQAHLVEGSAKLRREQAQLVPQAQFHDDLASVPVDGPMLLVANEFFDALPVRQLVMTDKGWREVLIGCDNDGRFVELPGPLAMDSAVPQALRDAPPGAVIETSPAGAAVVREIGQRLAQQGGAALIIDYGHAATRYGSSIQAVRGHQQADWRAAPGTADISAHVDFAALAQVASAAGAQAFGVAQQGAWLTALGAAQRFAALAQAAPERREELQVARDRLVSAEQMGALFKVLGLAGPGWPRGAGF